MDRGYQRSAISYQLSAISYQERRIVTLLMADG